MNYAIYFISKNMTPGELNYTVTKKEFLYVIHAINKFRNCIIGYEVYVHTNTFSIKYLMNKPITTSRVTRWLLLLQEFNVTILDKASQEKFGCRFLIKNQ